MKKIMLIVIVGCILVGTASQGAELSMSQLVRDISGCLCGGGSNAYQSGCNIYMMNRLQKNKIPEEAASKAINRCEAIYGPTKPNATVQCKEGVNFLRNKE